MAFLKKEVRLTDNKGTLYTQDLEYDLKTNIGKYKNGGRVVNGKTILTSMEGVYMLIQKMCFLKRKFTSPILNMKYEQILYYIIHKHRYRPEYPNLH